MTAPHLPEGPDLPDGVDPFGVPREAEGRQTFILLLAVVVALLGLTFTLGWVVFHHLTTSTTSSLLRLG